MFMINLNLESHYSLLDVDPGATPKEIVSARKKINRDFNERKKTDPNAKEIEERQSAVNSAADTLLRRDRRVEYDRKNAHLKFLVVRPAASTMFLDTADRLDVLRRVARTHLSNLGVELAPLSDIDRADFSSDETPVALLDDLLR